MCYELGKINFPSQSHLSSIHWFACCCHKLDKIIHPEFIDPGVEIITIVDC